MIKNTIALSPFLLISTLLWSAAQKAPRYQVGLKEPAYGGYVQVLVSKASKAFDVFLPEIAGESRRPNKEHLIKSLDLREGEKVPLCNSKAKSLWFRTVVHIEPSLWKELKPNHGITVVFKKNKLGATRLERVELTPLAEECESSDADDSSEAEIEQLEDAPIPLVEE